MCTGWLTGLRRQAAPPTIRRQAAECGNIFIDDLGYGDLGCYGNTQASTPNIDRLTSQGTRFTQFYANSPVCSPSHGYAYGAISC